MPGGGFPNQIDEVVLVAGQGSCLLLALTCTFARLMKKILS